jgi:uncharacterized delta-60 repeat protein
MRLREQTVVSRLRRYAPLGAVALAFALVLPAQASAGQLVKKFGGDGSVLRDFGRFDAPAAVVVDRRGRTVVAGDLLVDGSRRTYVARFRRNGKLDRKFSGNGVATTGRHKVNAEDLAIQPNGRIVVVGYEGWADEQAGDFFFDVAVVRFRADGRLDRDFARDGIRQFGFPDDESSAQGREVDVDAQGRICVGAQLPYYGQDRLAVARLLPDGALDDSFSDDGLAMAPGGALNGLVTQGDRIVVVGGSQLVRFSEDGDVDSTFGDDGVALVPISYPTLALSSSGDLLVAGSQPQAGTKDDFAVARLTADGDPDEAFAGGGLATADFYGKDDRVDGIAGVAGDRVLVVGTARNARGPGLDDDRWRFGVARFGPQGDLDPAFSENGKFTWAPRGSEYASATAVAPVPGTARAMVAGDGSEGKRDYSLVIALR